ncbi:MAG: CHAT domain-containing protein, partial [Pseudomonadota bacterium]|nr:CHAT domain-containing protein [Pseudomonadota bacterium]
AQAADLVADLTRAALAVQPSRDELATQRLASLANDTCILGDFGRAPGWPAPDRWSALAAALDLAIPVDFAFSRRVVGAEAAGRTAKVTVNLAGLAFLCGDADIGVSRCTCLLDAWSAAGDPVDYFVKAYRVRDLLAECVPARPILFSAVFALQRTIATHVDRFRAAHRSRAGRLLLAQLFSPLLDRLLSDLVQPDLPPAWQRQGPATERLYDALRERMFYISEQGRSRLLLDQLETAFLPFPTGFDATSLVATERRLLAMPQRQDPDGAAADVRLVARLPAVVWQDPRSTPAAAAGYRARFADIDAVEQAMREQDAGFTESARTAGLDEVQAELAPGEALMVYAIPRETLHPARQIDIIAITHERTRLVVVDLDILKQVPGLYRGVIGAFSLGGQAPLDISALAELVVWVRTAIRTESPEAAPALRLLHMLLVQPLEQVGITPAAYSHWFVVASGPLRAVPFGAALDAFGSHLGQRVALSFPPSASIWRAMRTDWQAPERFVGFANPVLDRSRWPDLPHATLEVEAAAGRLRSIPCATYVGPDATATRLYAEAAGASILHIATHGEFPEADAIDLHHLLLTPTADDDGVVSAERVRELRLRRTQLLVMSACNGGLLRFGPGEELHGLLACGLAAGASNLLSTLWPVNDAMTELWMQVFYRHLLAVGPAEAARRATTTLIEDGAAIRHWAPFVVVGATRIPTTGR